MRFTLLALVLLLTACGGSSPSSPPPPSSGPTIAISSSGVAPPKELTVGLGTRVQFTNQHSRPHNMTSDPHPEHDDCPELNQVGFLSTGQTKETGNLVAARTCGFHDHDDPNNTNLQGRIVIR